MSIVDSARWSRFVGLARRRAVRRAGHTDPAPPDAPAAASGGEPCHVEQDPATDPARQTPLFEVPFAVVDVETTGGSPATAALTEIGAAKYRGGECIGTFATLVDPRCAVPPLITLLTGITDAMVCGAPPVDSVLPSFLEFVRGSVIVGHNVGFDLAFLNAALAASGRDPLDNEVVDTLALARRLLKPDVPNCRLRTLAATLDLEHRPSHRALDDVLATADLLHRLIEAATGYGVFVLADLVDLMTAPPLRRACVS